MYLIDTNIWLELLLQQDKAGEVSSFFQAVDASSLAITDFTLYSIGIILTRLKKYDVFDDFVRTLSKRTPSTGFALTHWVLNEFLTYRNSSAWISMTPTNMSLLRETD